LGTPRLSQLRCMETLKEMELVAGKLVRSAFQGGIFSS
jgi:hypothetical protein